MSEIQETTLENVIEKAVIRAKEQLEGFEKEEFLETDTKINDETIETEKPKSKLISALFCFIAVGGLFYTIYRIKRGKNGTA
ncbi:MAG: hypothetical protein LBB59_00955 [Campylobacteraceae bacterium]|jgi:hypothetical protein|nr:hypothetical protein [Campylobacteraceae bacterium]